MKKKRKVILTITLISYFLFISFIHFIGIVTNNPIKNEKNNNVRNDVVKIYSTINSVLSVMMKIDTNSGMDPTPNPPLPPNPNDGIETEILD